MTISALYKKVNWWVWVLGIDFFLALMTGVHKYLPESAARSHLRHFTLSTEKNPAAWWSGISLFVAGCLAYEVFCNLKSNARNAWLILAILFTALSADELGSFHEAIGGGGWINFLPYGVLGIVLLTYVFIKLFQEKQSRFSATCILLGFTIFGSVAVQEYFEHALDWPYWLSGLRVAVEEGSELLAIFLCLVAIVRQRCSSFSSSTLPAILPNPWRMKSLSLILLGGTAFHFVMSLYFVSSLMNSEFSYRGNPAVWYPSVVSFLLFCASIWRYLDSTSNRPLPWLMLSVYSLICSILIIREPVKLLGVGNQFYLFYFFQIAVIGLGVFYAERSIKTINYNFLWPFPILVGSGVIGFMIGGALIQYVLLGFLYYGLYESLVMKKIGIHRRAALGRSETSESNLVHK